MDRESAKHSPRMDEQIKHEVESLTSGHGIESRAQEGRLVEDSTDRYVGAPDSLDARSTIARFLDPGGFPADKRALVADARRNQAYDWVVDRLESLPDGRQFENVQAVWESLGGGVEDRF
ncbi:MAG TPA: DUF2795 domain-containing protein [Actinomycetota bacterium]|jgi:hypothetical protein|nr:DUF2795 domain-containing protein [Actinomycetota bacterium]